MTVVLPIILYNSCCHIVELCGLYDNMIVCINWCLVKVQVSDLVAVTLHNIIVCLLSYLDTSLELMHCSMSVRKLSLGTNFSQASVSCTLTFALCFCKWSWA